MIVVNEQKLLRMTDIVLNCSCNDDRIKMIERLTEMAAGDLSSYLLKGITEGVSYDNLKTKSDIPCCRDKYYEMYRKFFYILNIERQ